MILIQSEAYTQALTANHSHTDLGIIPEEWIETACGEYKLFYGHTSHGSQIVTGMEVIEELYGSPFLFNQQGTNGALSVYEQWTDLGHNGDLSWEQYTRNQLNDPSNDRNLVMWSWCGGCSDNTYEGINIYLEAMNQLELDYPDVTFIYMTGHLDGSGEEGNLHERNNQIREYCEAHEKILFDFADIESYDPDGNYYLPLYADDACNYNGGNWADEWCGNHSGSDLCHSCSCAHSRSLNCNLKGRAFWWLMARITGWDGTQTGMQEDNVNEVFHIYPNPTDNMLNYYINLPENTSYTINILLPDGRCVHNSGKRLITNPLMGDIPSAHQLHGLKKGLYLCVLTTEKKKICKKVILN